MYDERWKTQFLCFGLREDQRYLQHVNVMTRIWITNSCKVSTVGNSTRNGEGGGGDTSHLTSTSALSGGSLELAVSGNTRLQALDAGYLNIIIVPLYCILLWQLGIIVFTLMASCDEKSLDILVQFCAPNQFSNSNSLHSNHWPGRAELSRTRGTRGDPGQRETYYRIKLPTWFIICTCTGKVGTECFLWYVSCCSLHPGAARRQPAADCSR